MKTGILINNIGTPQSYDPEDVGAYLSEFLMDKNIIGAPYWIRYFLVHFVIVPRRKFKSALKYKSIWGKKKSPLYELTDSFSLKLQQELDSSYVVEMGMRYGEPSLKKAFQKLLDQNCEQIIFAPMYPQYAQATTGSAQELFLQILNQFKSENKLPSEFKYKFLAPFYNLNSFSELQAQNLKNAIKAGQYEHIIFSFHGLPESQLKVNKGCRFNKECCSSEMQRASGCYRAQCFATAENIAAKAQLPDQHYTVSFQSRFGPTAWIKPYTSAVVSKLATDGAVKNVLVQSPSFVADCIETLEELNIELKDEFIEKGGGHLSLVSCLNDQDSWVKAFSDLLKKQIL